MCVYLCVNIHESIHIYSHRTRHTVCLCSDWFLGKKYIHGNRLAFSCFSIFRKDLRTGDWSNVATHCRWSFIPVFGLHISIQCERETNLFDQFHSPCSIRFNLQSNKNRCINKIKSKKYHIMIATQFKFSISNLSRKEWDCFF